MNNVIIAFLLCFLSWRTTTVHTSVHVLACSGSRGPKNCNVALESKTSWKLLPRLIWNLVWILSVLRRWFLMILIKRDHLSGTTTVLLFIHCKAPVAIPCATSCMYRFKLLGGRSFVGRAAVYKASGSSLGSSWLCAKVSLGKTPKPCSSSVVHCLATVQQQFNKVCY